MSNEVFVASTSIDRPNFLPVAQRLGDMGHDVIIYEADMVARGLIRASWRIDRDDLVLDYDGNSYPASNVTSAWYRKPNLIYNNHDDLAKQQCLEAEANLLQEAFWLSVPDNSWLNSPANIRLAENKLTQLHRARQIGFSVPDTVVSNDWQEITSTIPTKKIAMKMSKGYLYDKNGARSLYTQMLSRKEIGQLAETTPYPAIFQSYLPKSREWRVTVVGDDVFDVAIYTSDKAKDDWRRHQGTDEVTFQHERIADGIEASCIKYLGEVGLRYGAFDFIEDKDGKITFLELNPNGKYVWIENMFGLPISSCIASQLSEIAKTNSDK